MSRAPPRKERPHRGGRADRGLRVEREVARLQPGGQQPHHDGLPPILVARLRHARPAMGARARRRGDVWVRCRQERTETGEGRHVEVHVMATALERLIHPPVPDIEEIIVPTQETTEPGQNHGVTVGSGVAAGAN